MPGNKRARMPAVSVLIVNYDAGPNLARTLAGLVAQTFADFEALIIDNASNDRSIDMAQSQVPDDRRFKFTFLTRNIGFAAANNVIAATAQADWLALLNPDAVPTPDWLERLIEAAKRHPNAAMLGSTQIDADDPCRLDGAGDQYFALGIPWRGGYGWPLSDLPPEGEVFSPCAAACLIRADAFHEAGGFDDRFFCYVEDVDLAFRLRLLGHHCIQVPSAVVTHIGGASSLSSGFARMYGTRNLMWCFAKCMPPALYWPLLPLHLLALAFLMASAIATGMARPVGAGIAAGFAGMPAMWSSRRAVQRARRVPSHLIAAALTWNPVLYLRRVPYTL